MPPPRGWGIIIVILICNTNNCYNRLDQDSHRSSKNSRISYQMTTYYRFDYEC